MKIQLISVLCAGTLSCMALPVLAADNSTADETHNTQGERDVAPSYRNRQFSMLNEANKILGLEVKDNQGERLGKVKDLGLDLQNGRVVEVIVARGGVLGVDETLVAVPPSVFAYDDSMKSLRLSVSREQFTNSPSIQWSHWKDSTESTQVTAVYQQYGVQPYYGQLNKDNTSANGASTVSDMSQTSAAGSRSDYSNRSSNSQSGEVNAQNPSLAYTNDNTSATLAAITNNHGHASRIWAATGDASTNGQYYAQHRPVSLGYVTRATKVIGSSAVNNQNEKLGKVKDLIVDLQAGRIVEVILASGGFLGIDGELSAIPPQAFQYESQNEALTLDTTADALKSAPHFKASEWRNASDPNHISEVYSTYHVPAYFSYNDQESTGQNVRYRDENALTPMDQGNNANDIDTTAQIRKSIMSDRSMSINAQNVKIITVNGTVTLRGIVNNEDEKRTIADTATKIAGADKVDNELQISATPNSGPNSSTTNLNEPSR